MGVGWINLAQDIEKWLVCSFEHSNEASGFIKCGEFLG
jgi:hypothetical protein